MFRLPGQVEIVAVGKMRTKHWRTAQDDYLQRLQRYGRFSLTEVKDAIGKGLPDAAAMAREGEQLLKAAADANRLILLSPMGKQMSSEKLASFLKRQASQYGRLAFLIGGPVGFDAAVETAVHEQIALSRLTFTHELARVLLLEQLYRGCTILNGEPYHK